MNCALSKHCKVPAGETGRCSDGRDLGHSTVQATRQCLCVLPQTVPASALSRSCANFGVRLHCWNIGNLSLPLDI